MSDEKRVDELRIKAKSLFDSKIKAHITLSQSAFFYNGLIVQLANDWLIIDDRKLGESVLWFIDIKKIDPFIFGSGL